MKQIVMDERYMVVEKAILCAYMELIREKEIDKISVADVIKKAGIARSTFYNHFEDIPSLVSAVKDKTVEDIFAMMMSFKPKNDKERVRTYFYSICRYTMENPFLCELLATPQADHFFDTAISAFHRYVTEASGRTGAVEHSEEEVSYVITGIIGSTIGVLHKWSREQFKVPIESVVDILTSVFMGMLPLLS